MKKIAWLLVLALCMSLCSCSKKIEVQKREQDYITDGVWFSNIHNYTTEFELYDTGTATLGQGEIIYADSTKLISYVERENNGPDDLTGDNDDVAYLTEYVINEDGDGAIVASRFDLKAEGYVYRSADYQDASVVTSLMYLNNKVYAVIDEVHYDYDNFNNNTYHVYIQEFDLETNTATRTINSDSLEAIVGVQSYVIKSWIADTNLYLLVSCDDAYSVVTLDENFEVTNQTVISNLNAGQIINEAYNIGDNDLILFIYDYLFDEQIYYKFDVSTGVLTQLDDINLTSDWNNVGSAIVRSDTYGVYSFDVETGKTETILDFNNCNINRFAASISEVVYVDNDTVILKSSCYDRNCDEIWKFTREATNPNAGKAIIRVADLDGQIEDYVAAAIYEFNETSTSSYMVLDDRYIVDNLIDSGDNSFLYSISDEYISMSRNAASTVTNQMRVDILAGNGPDIILDAYEYSDFNNSNCLLDLRDLLLADNSTDYINAVSSGDEPIYQFPTSVYPSTLVWSRNISDYTNEDGFTVSYENYIDMVNDVGNGFDPLAYYFGRTDYFIELFDYNFDKFVSGKSIDIDNDEFRAMAEFVMTRPLVYTYDEKDHSTYNSYYSEYMVDGEVANKYICSVPGSEGLILRCRSSVAISATCPDVESAVAFAKIIIEENSKYLVAGDIYSNLISAIDSRNERIARDNKIYGMNDPLLDYENADIYADIMASAIGIYTYDADINVILYEEMQSYFVGDKTIDEVIDIIEDRASTVLHER